MALTGRAALLALLGVFFVGWVLPSWAGVGLVLLVLCLLIALDVALAANVRQLMVRRSGDVSVRLTERAGVRLVVRNSGKRALRATLRDLWPPSGGATPSRIRLQVPPGEAREALISLLPTRRGDRSTAGVTVRAAGPLRIAARQRTLDVPWTVRVLPAFPSRKHLPSKVAKLHEMEGRSAILLRGAGSEFDSLREYVIGDDVRMIDWRSSARRSDVVVKTWRPERDRHITLVLDTSRTSAGRVGDAPRLDAAMDAALLLGALAGRAGDHVDLLAYDRQLRARVSGATGSAILPALVEAMAPLEPELIEADMRGLVANVLTRAPRHALVVLLTGLDPAAVEEGLLPALPSLVRRHTVLVGAVADPAVADLAQGRGDIAAVYSAAAAEVTRGHRQHIVDRMRRMGVEVVDETPGVLAPALADRYLALKMAGRL